jgi:hypothetical protein
VAFAVLAVISASSVDAEPVAEVPSAVTTFERLCLTGGVDPASRPTALSGAGWTKDAAVTVNVAGFNVSKAIERNYDFAKPDAVEQWSGSIDNRPARVVLAAYPVKRRYRHLCALLIDDVANALPYGEPLKMAFKTFGIGGKSVDLAHYFEYAGKVGADKHPVRGEIFTRSVVSGAKNSMHIYVAY